jgi:hypothetical protein
MRNILLIIILLSAAVLSTSCATASVSSSLPSDAKTQTADAPDLLFSDWEYRGFGRELPGWVSAFFEGGTDAVRAACSAYEGKDILVISASGGNADQADSALVEKLTNGPSHAGYVLTESIWVRLNREKEKALYSGDAYVSLCLYVKQQKP